MKNLNDLNKVYLVPSHHSFDQAGEEMTYQMIEKPFRNTEFSIECAETYRKMLEALTKINPQLMVKISIGISGGWLDLPKRVWINFYYNEKCIYTTSHRDKDDYPYYNVVQWTELGQEKAFALSVEDWINLFSKRIKQKITKQKTIAKEIVAIQSEIVVFSEQVLKIFD